MNVLFLSVFLSCHSPLSYLFSLSLSLSHLYISQGGLYVLGHVMVQPFNKDIAEYHNKQLKLWLDLVEISKVKAFVELTISDSVRNGARNLLTVSKCGPVNFEAKIKLSHVFWGMLFVHAETRNVPNIHYNLPLLF